MILQFFCALLKLLRWSWQCCLKQHNWIVYQRWALPFFWDL